MIEKRFDPRNTPEHLTYNLYKATSPPPPYTQDTDLRSYAIVLFPKNRMADVDIADILGVAEANVLMLLVILNLTLGIIWRS